MDALRKEKKCYSYADYYTWNDNERWELIEGVPFAMSPAPSWFHQAIIGNIYNQLHNFLKGKPCRVLVAPVDVCLYGAGDNDKTVVQPDILIVCDKSKLKGKYCNGAPDMVIEVLSPTSVKHDRIIKFQQYQQAGVHEYWIVDPDTKSVSTHILNNGEYTIRVYFDSDNVPVHVLEGCSVDLTEVFDYEIDIGLS